VSPTVPVAGNESGGPNDTPADGSGEQSMQPTNLSPADGTSPEQPYTPASGGIPFDGGEYRTWSTPTSSGPENTTSEAVHSVIEVGDAAELAEVAAGAIEGTGAVTGTALLEGIAGAVVPGAAEAVAFDVLFGTDPPSPDAVVGICIDPATVPDLNRSVAADAPADSYPGLPRAYPDDTGGVAAWPGGDHGGQVAADASNAVPTETPDVSAPPAGTGSDDPSAVSTSSDQDPAAAATGATEDHEASVCVAPESTLDVSATEGSNVPAEGPADHNADAATGTPAGGEHDAGGGGSSFGSTDAGAGVDATANTNQPAGDASAVEQSSAGLDAGGT